MSELYSPELLQRAKDVSRVGGLPEATARAEVKNTLCGDRSAVAVHLEGGTLTRVRHVTRGCAVANASAALMAELCEGVSPEEARRLYSEVHSRSIFAPLAEAPSRKRCVTLPWEALMAALSSCVT